MIFQWFELAWDQQITSLLPPRYCYFLCQRAFKHRVLLPLF